MVVPVAAAGVRAARDNTTATVLVGVLGLLVVANAVSKLGAPLDAAKQAAGAVADAAEDAARETRDFFRRPSDRLDATDIFLPPPFPDLVGNIERDFNTTKAFLGGVFVGPEEDEVPPDFFDVDEELFESGGFIVGEPPAVPLATPTRIHGDAEDAGRAIRDFFRRLF